MTGQELDKITEYLSLINLFIAGRLPAAEFQSTFLRLFKSDPNLWEGETYHILESIFEEVESFESDRSIRSEHYIGEDQLRNTLKMALQKLQALLSHSRPNS